MPKLKASETAEREAWVIERFKKDPHLSGPRMVELMKRKFKHQMRATRIYELRDVVLQEMGWGKDEYGHPVKPSKAVVQQAFRKSGEEATKGTNGVADPLFGRCVVPCEDVTDGVSFQQKLAFMNEKGFLSPQLQVEAVTDSYMIIRRA